MKWNPCLSEDNIIGTILLFKSVLIILLRFPSCFIYLRDFLTLFESDVFRNSNTQSVTSSCASQPTSKRVNFLKRVSFMGRATKIQKR